MKYLFMILAFMNGAIHLPAQSKNWKFTSSKKEVIQLSHIESWFSYIPTQSYSLEDKTVSLKGFYMMKWETPNMLYRLFVNDLKNNGKLADLQSALPDTSCFSGLDPYREYYFRHPAYNQYPVMQVSRDGVSLFCGWLNEKIKTVSLKDWKGKKITFRLPTEMEWMVAAAGGDPNAIYAWKGNYLRKLESHIKKGERIYSGDYQANFCRIDDGQITRDENGDLKVTNESKNQISDGLFDGAYLTAPVYSYWPNDYGLFTMCGNAREMVQEEGFTKGGGWMDPGADLKITARNTYKKEGFPCEGFRLVAEVE
jgi:formylglycine-generating enzyme required for sulfatase activity